MCYFLISKFCVFEYLIINLRSLQEPALCKMQYLAFYPFPILYVIISRHTTDNWNRIIQNNRSICLKIYGLPDLIEHELVVHQYGNTVHGKLIEIPYVRTSKWNLKRYLFSSLRAGFQYVNLARLNNWTNYIRMQI